MGAEEQIGGVATLDRSHGTQRLRPRSANREAFLQAEAVRARIIAATVEVVADGTSNPRLAETGVMRESP
jgi:hypothetical protein